jgi:GTPase Era involved in 16S rRNA processing/vacuolar-type H+-ATPase subunit E/Vma4
MKPADYQQCRQQLLSKIDRLRELRDELASRDPLFINGLPIDVRQKMLLLDRESTRLRNPDLTIAFVGGFSAGKSSLVNAFLGRYLLPESVKVTTAVPTFVRSTSGQETAELHYLNEAEIEKLGDLYRHEIASIYRTPELAGLPYSTLLESVKPLATEGRGRGLVEQFQIYQDQKRSRQLDPRGRVITTSIDDAKNKIRDETEAMFLDRVVIHARATQLPEDVVLVDLPGISVPNPRHREITFRFVREEAHALVFVLMATRLFDKDEIEIVELVRAGESRIADKTFWVLNRWDSLSVEQQRQTITDFENKTREFAIPSGFPVFKTNALHGLLAHLAILQEAPQDLALQRHIKDYEDALAARYGSSHETALRESEVPKLQKEVLAFLNDRLRKTTLRSAWDNARANFCDPVPHHLRRARDEDDALLNGDLKRQEKEVSRQRVEERCNQRRSELTKQLKQLKDEVAVNRAKVLREQTKEVVNQLRAKIEGGPETDAYEIYKEIIAGRELRKYPYHFEIEMRVVDNLNSMLKRSFRQIVRSQVEEVFSDLVKRVHNALEKVREDVNYNANVLAPFDEVIKEESGSFIDKIDGVVMTKAAELDASLVYKPKTWFGFFGGNEILDGLNKAARLGFENFRNPGQAITPGDMDGKTKAIRETLTQHYIDTVRHYHEVITGEIFPIIINNLHQIEIRLLDVLQSKYHPALETVMSQEVEGEFSSRKKGVEERSRRFRDTIEQIEQLQGEIASIFAQVPA